MKTDSQRGFSTTELEAYVRSTIHTEATYLSSLLKELYECYPMSEDTQLINYLLDLLAVASKDDERRPKPH